MANLVLYKQDACPFCQKVMRFMDANNIEIEQKDIIEDKENKKYLIENGGQDLVPCLFIDGKPLYESDEIITYLEENLVQGEYVQPDLSDIVGMCPMDLDDF